MVRKTDHPILLVFALDTLYDLENVLEGSSLKVLHKIWFKSYERVYIYMYVCMYVYIYI